MFYVTYRLAITTVPPKNEVTSREEEGGGEEINAGVVVATAPTSPNGDDDRRDDNNIDDDDDRPVERLVLRGEDSVAALMNKNGGACALVGSRCAWRLLTMALVKIDMVGTLLGDAGLGTIVAALTPWLRELSAPGIMY